MCKVCSTNRIANDLSKDPINAIKHLQRATPGLKCANFSTVCQCSGRYNGKMRVSRKSAQRSERPLLLNDILSAGIACIRVFGSVETSYDVNVVSAPFMYHPQERSLFAPCFVYQHQARHFCENAAVLRGKPLDGICVFRMIL